jgi:uncharacterized phage protein gp47/JayE
MPYPRPPLSVLRSQVSTDISEGLKTVDGLLRFSNLGILGTSVAGLAHQHYGFLAWIAKQASPWTATDEYLDAWAALKNVFRDPALVASLQASWLGTPGALLPQGTEVVIGNGVYYTTAADALADGAGHVSVTVVARLAGAAGNAEVGSLVTLTSAVDGIQSSGAVTASVAIGTDVEKNEPLRTRMLAAYQAPARGGTALDYKSWAMNCPGVTRAWVQPMGAGPGTVVVYVMFDLVNSANNGFPVGTNGLSSLDNRAIPATTAAGNQLVVANMLFASQPVTPLVYTCAPAPNPIPFTITGLLGASAALKAAVADAIAQVMIDEGDPAPVAGSVVELDSLNAAISAVPGTAGFVITSPVANIANVLGQLPTVGAITYG